MKAPRKTDLKAPASRFGIGEWYGNSFANLTESRRRELATVAINHTNNTAPICPFKEAHQRCHKKGGVCSLRLYDPFGEVVPGSWSATVRSGNDGDLRAVCPARFRQNSTIYRSVGLTVLGTDSPIVVNEVRFLQREEAEAAEQSDDSPPLMPEEDDAAHEDVGNIDNVLLFPGSDPLKWCALELQAVYFSGKAMKLLFEHIRDFPSSDLPFPDRGRRPDYRSSGPKRLMPQLQIKVPTLRRWGKKMAIVVDKAFYRNMGKMDTVSDLSNCDIAWFLVAFDETTDPPTLLIEGPEKQTLERAVEGLTGGFPVTLAEFEAKIKDKLNPAPKRKNKKTTTTL